MHDLKVFAMFSRFLGSKDPWKATSEDIAAYCAYRADMGISTSTIRGDIGHLNYVFEKLGKGHFRGETGRGVIIPGPGRAPVVRQVLQGINALNPRTVKQQLPITLECLEALMDVQPDNLFGLRNRALFALIWAGAMRVREVVGLDMAPGPDSRGHAILRDDGVILVLMRSKSRRFPTVPEHYGIPVRTSSPKYCPVLLLNEWIREALLTSGPLFPAISSRNLIYKNRANMTYRVAQLLRDSLNQIGLPAKEYGVRSLRAGCIEWLLNEGVLPAKVKDHAGHVRLSSTFAYLRGRASIEASAFSQTSWIKQEAG